MDGLSRVVEENITVKMSIDLFRSSKKDIVSSRADGTDAGTTIANLWQQFPSAAGSSIQ
jgi:hypothetical protein